jgi:hypothetical protein
MDIVATVNDAVLLLAPALPYLVAKTGDVATKGAIKKVGKEAWGVAQGLWEKLRPAVEASPAASEAVDDLAAEPDNQDCRGGLRARLRKLLEADPALAEEVARLIEEGRSAGVNVTSSGDRSVTVGGTISNNIIVTGDGNKVKGS